MDKAEDLVGPSETNTAQCKKGAEGHDGKVPYCIAITNTTRQPTLASLESRALHERVFNASAHHADGTRDFNTFPIIVEMTEPHAERAELMGFENYAAYSLNNTMVKSMDNLNAPLKQSIGAYTPKTNEETHAIETYVQKTIGTDFKLQSYDRFYYSARVEKKQFNFSGDEVEPYFDPDSVLVNGALFATNKAYGLSFEECIDLPTCHKGTEVFDVVGEDGK